MAAIVDDLIVLIDELPQNYDWLHEVQRRKERETGVPSDWTLSQTARQADLFNPYHDERGRFTSKAGAGGSAAPASGGEDALMLAQMAKAKQEDDARRAAYGQAWHGSPEAVAARAELEDSERYSGERLSEIVAEQRMLNAELLAADKRCDAAGLTLNQVLEGNVAVEAMAAINQEWEAALKNLDETRARLRPRLTELQELWEGHADYIAKGLPGSCGVKNPTKFQLQGDFTPEMQKGADEAARYIDRAVFNDPTGMGQPIVITRKAKGREWCELDGKSVAMSLGSKPYDDNTMIHELGHAVEAQVPELHAAAVSFLLKRIGSEPIRPLNEIELERGWGFASYEPDELGARDRFYSTYMGKMYVHPGSDKAPRVSAHYATEIISMGLERMARQPLDFARDDPEYFDFMYDVMRGRYSDR